MGYSFERYKRYFNNYYFSKILDESNHKPNKIRVEKNGIEMYLIRNVRKSVVAERFIRILNNKIQKYMTLISKNVYIDKLDETVFKYNNTYHRRIKIKPADIKSNTYINFSIEINHKDPTFKIGDIDKISKYKNIFAKGCLPNWPEEVF